MRSLVGLLLIASVLYLGLQVLPAYVANVRLEEAINDTAYALSRALPEAEARQRVVAEARALDIDLSPEQVTVQKFNNEGFVRADYTVHVALPVYPLDLHFQPASRNRKWSPGF